MNSVKLTIRLNPSQFRTLNSLAEQRAVPRYRMLGRIISSGFSATLGGADRDTELREIATEVGAMSARLIELERVLDRTLFTACAAYAYARNSALGLHRSDDAISAESLAAFERQRSLASEQNS